MKEEYKNKKLKMKRQNQDPDILSYEDEGIEMPDSDDYRDIPDFDKQKKKGGSRKESRENFKTNKNKHDYSSGINYYDDDNHTRL